MPYIIRDDPPYATGAPYYYCGVVMGIRTLRADSADAKRYRTKRDAHSERVVRLGPSSRYTIEKVAK